MARRAAAVTSFPLMQSVASGDNTGRRVGGGAASTPTFMPNESMMPHEDIPLGRFSQNHGTGDTHPVA